MISETVDTRCIHHVLVQLDHITLCNLFENKLITVNYDTEFGDFRKYNILSLAATAN